MISLRRSGATQPRGVRYSPLSLNFSMYTSSTFGPKLVNPQAMERLCPTMTNGTPGSVTPATSKSPAVRWASYQTLGICKSRCISLESSGLPDAVCAPDTTQLLDPG